MLQCYIMIRRFIMIYCADLRRLARKVIFRKSKVKSWLDFLSKKKVKVMTYCDTISWTLTTIYHDMSKRSRVSFKVRKSRKSQFFIFDQWDIVIYFKNKLQRYWKNYDFDPLPLPSRYRPVTIFRPSWLNMTLRPSSWPHRPSPSLNVPRRPSTSLTVPHRPTPSHTFLQC